MSFSERTIEIRDKGDRLVLTGNARTLEWHRHVTSPDEIEKIKAQQKDLYQKASYESGWDNYETARQLRRQAEQLSLGFVEECWRNHPEVIQAVEKFEYPVFIDEEMALLMQIRMLVLTDGQLVADANIMNRNRPEQVLLTGWLSMATTLAHFS